MPQMERIVSYTVQRPQGDTSVDMAQRSHASSDDSHSLLDREVLTVSRVTEAPRIVRMISALGTSPVAAETPAAAIRIRHMSSRDDRFRPEAEFSVAASGED